MVKVGDIWFECDGVKITKIEFNNFCNSNTVYMLFYKWSAFKEHWAGPSGCRLLSDLRRSHRNSILNSHRNSILKTSFHCLLSLIFVTFFIHWPLSPAVSMWTIQWRWSFYIRILCGLLLFDSSPISKKCCCVFVTLLMMIQNA